MQEHLSVKDISFVSFIKKLQISYNKLEQIIPKNSIIILVYLRVVKTSFLGTLIQETTEY